MNLDFFEKENLFEATKSFFNELNIAIKTYTREAQSIENVLGKNYEIVNSVYVNYIDENSFENLDQILASSKYKGILLFSLDLKKIPKRKEIADLTRAFNHKSKGMPVCLLLKYGTKISLALSERTDYKQEWREGEKIGKVIILRDIDTENPHTGHLRILDDLKKYNIKNFSELYEKWLEIFNVNVLNKKFYAELSDWYFWAIKEVEFPDDMEKNEDIRNSTNLIRLVTRIIFIWFIKEKKLVPENLFDEKELETILKDFKKKGNYYNAILQNLFFGTLNQKIKERKFVEDSDFNSNKNEYGVKNLYRYANMFKKDEKEICKLFRNIPFLNGGLFDCLDKEDENGRVKYIDGFSRNKNKQAKIPDVLFFSSDENKGLIKILNSYKFTVTENTPQEEDVALDPELLGKVFENLLASYNPETKETARKQSGSFYTPREIVNYMVNESLAAYLREKVGEGWENNKQTISALNDIKILDPACGSGAFPMGILHKMVEILQKLDPDNKEWRKLQEEKATYELKDAIKIVNQQERDNRLKEISDIFENNSSDYGRKLFLIENCIFGIDIQPIAVQISKLRFFISLIIDQKTDETKENLGIRPLPNLETKFVAANTLVGLNRPELSLFDTEIIDKQNEIRENVHQYFAANTRRKKMNLQEKERRLYKELGNLFLKNGWRKEIVDKVVSFDRYDQNIKADWFDAELMFGVVQKKDGLNGTSGGFDIVIGNPPYISSKELKDKHLYESTYKTAKGQYDIFILFIEKSFDLCRKSGIHSFIIPDSYMGRSTFAYSRELFFKKSACKKFLQVNDVFENANVSSFIYVVKCNSSDYQKIIFTKTNSCNDWSSGLFNQIEITQSSILKSNNYKIIFLSENKLKLINKIFNHKNKIDNTCTLWRGEEIGKKSDLVFDDYKNDYCLPILSGTNVQMYYLKTPMKYIDKRNIRKRIPDYLKEKVVIRQLGDRINAMCDTNGHITTQSVYSITSDVFSLPFLTGLLNSKLINFLYQNYFSEKQEFPRILLENLKDISIPNIPLSEQQPIATLANQILSVKKKNNVADTSDLERKIDTLVYGLYGLTMEEIGIIENSEVL